MPAFFRLAALVMLVLAGCAYTGPRNSGPRVLVMGDSLLAWHSAIGHSIPDAMQESLGEPVVNRSVSGARVLLDLPESEMMGLRISNQYAEGNWEWVVLNGGGNDLWLGCGCLLCDAKLDRMISEDGSGGTIPDTVAKLRGTGARVVYLGYLRSPGRWSIIEHCRDEGNRLDTRLEKMAERNDGVYFLSLAGMVPYGDRSYHAPDMIHPSVKASRVIGEALAKLVGAMPAGTSGASVLRLQPAS